MSAASWTRFHSASLVQRPEPEEFLSFIEIQSSQHPISPAALSDLFLRPSEESDYCLDTLVREWLHVMHKGGFVTVPAVLKAMMRYSTFGTKDNNEGVKDALNDKGKEEEHSKKEKRWRHSYYSDEIMFYKIGGYISSSETRQSTQQDIDLLTICIEWMELVFNSGHAVNDMLITTQKQAEISATTNALGTLMVNVVESANVQKLLSNGTVEKGTGNHLSRALANFIPLLQSAPPGTTERLEVFRTKTLISIQPIDKKDIAASKEIDEMLGEGIEVNPDNVDVPELSIMRSRAGLYIYFNALLIGRPLIDDSEILGYLQNRYQNDLQTMTVDLILAAFDVLANIIFRKEPGEKEQSKFVLRTFLINKVPLLIANLSVSFFPPLTTEFCIGEALENVDTNAFPTFASLSADSSYDNMFSDSVRQDFCFACCLHGLLEESSIQNLLGDVPMQSLPTGGRYTKENLIQQCLSDSEKPEALIDELENMDGNVGAVSQAITTVIGQLCRNKDTMTLKSICSKLARKGSYLDVMLIFDKPITILQPICDLLDNWRYEEDQGEYQPVYEEFGSILLLVLAFVTRYDLSAVDIGIRSPSSFIAKLIQQGHFAKTDDTLTPTENSQLTGWIRGLFNNESGGLGDELMSACPPQDFYLLVATLFHHTVLACSTNHLPEDVLKLGLEYLVEPFLLPALIPGIAWLSSHLWTSREDANAVIQILSALISNSNSISTEASHMLNSILNIVAKNLEHSLRYLQKAEPLRQDVEPLLRNLRSNVGWERRGASDHTEYESWTLRDNNHVSMCANIRSTLVGLVQWAMNAVSEISYMHTNTGIGSSFINCTNGVVWPIIDENYFIENITHTLQRWLDNLQYFQGIPAAYTHRQILVGLKILGAKKLLQTIVAVVKVQTEIGNGSAVLDVATAVICAPDSASWEAGVISATDTLMNLTPQRLQRRMTLREALKIEAEIATAAIKTDLYHAVTVVRLQRRVEAQMLNLNLPSQPIMALAMPDMGVGEGGGLGGDDLLAGMDMSMGVGGLGDGGLELGGTLEDGGDLFGEGMEF